MAELNSSDDIPVAKVSHPFREMVGMFFRNYNAVVGLILSLIHI